MLIHVDEAFIDKFSGFKLDDIKIEPINKDKHIELMEEQKYPAIIWVRLDKGYDFERYVNGFQEVINEDTIDLYELPEPYNVVYQLEVVSKERYLFDMLEMFIDSCIRPRCDVLPIKCVIESEANIEKVIKFPMRIVETRQLDDYTDSKNVYYRKIYTISVKLLIDLNVLAESSYKIKNDVCFIEA